MVRRGLVLFLAFVLLSCSGRSEKDLDGVEILQSGRVVSVVNVELAETSFEHAQGLMFRKDMPEDQGMWFIYNRDVSQPFWMKNTYISLDIIFVDGKNRIVSIAKETKPLSTDRIHPKGPFRYVLEVNAGFADKNRLKPGDIIRLK